MTGLISGWIDPTAAGTYSTTITVDDFDSGISTVNFAWNVSNVNHTPHLYRSRHRQTTVGQSISANAPGTLDIDGDSITYSATGLPPGITYTPGPSGGTITGTTTVAGTYNVSVLVNDGNGGTDSDSFIWRVVEPTAVAPVAEVYFGEPYVNTSNTTGNSLALHRPAVPTFATVVMQNPNDGSALVPVTLTITDGRSVLGTTSVSLRHGESTTVSVTALNVSQRPQDVFIKTFVNGGESSRDTMTNVGMVLPYRIRAKDTPEGMKDRISLGTGNWGSYFGTVGIFPNLKGTSGISLSIKRPEEDDKYGNGRGHRGHQPLIAGQPGLCEGRRDSADRGKLGPGWSTRWPSAKCG